MSDLQEIRRFWPKATWWGKNMHAAANGLHGLLWIERVKVGLHRVVYVPENWGRKDFDGPTIAAAMAAAGFGVRSEGKFAHAKRQQHYWRTPEGYDPFVKLEGRQRPRKGVRLGKRGRRLALAASIAKARLLVAHRRGKSTLPAQYNALIAQQRNDRGEIGG